MFNTIEPSLSSEVSKFKVDFKYGKDDLKSALNCDKNG